MVRFPNPLRRLLTTDTQKRALPGNELGGLCDRCVSIDFDQFLHPGPVAYRGEGKALDLGELRNDSNCPVCRLFASRKYKSHLDYLPSASQHAGHSAKLCPAFNVFEEYIDPEKRLIDPLWPTRETPKSYGLVIVSNTVLRNGEGGSQTQMARDFLGRYLILPAHEGSATFGLPPGEIEGARISEHGVNYPRMLDWLQRCDDKHSGTCCRLEKRFAVPIDCIDCFTREIVTMNGDAEYLALSYTWGTGVTYPKAAEGTKRLPDDDELPRVIRDAMAVVRGLGRRHFWVDQYCISQSDPEAKARQILQMDVVYEQAYATIVAGAGTDADFGLPGVGETPRNKQLAARTSTLTLVSASPPLAEVLSSKGWISRGWTYQEAALSRRLLVFTDYEVYFVCAAMTCSESLVAQPNDDSAGEGERPIALQSDFFYLGRIGHQDSRHSPKSRTLIQQLMAHIQEYSARKLTFESDALNAFRGILSRWPFCSYYGIPFAVNDPAQRRNPEALLLGFLLFLAWNKTHQGGSRRAHHAFPSWSWSGWAGSVIFDGLYDVNPDPGLPHAQISLEGPLKEAIAAQGAGSVDGPRILPELSPHLRIKTLVLQLRFQVLLNNYGHEAILCRCHPCGAHGNDRIYRSSGLNPRASPGEYWATAALDDPPRRVGTLGRTCVLLFADRFTDRLSGMPDQEKVRRTFLIVRQCEGVAYRAGTIQIVDDRGSTLESLLREVPHEMREIVLG